MSRSAWATARRLARQHAGYIHRRALLACGISPSAIDRAVQAGYLVARHRGVYCFAPEPVEPRLQAWAAVVACGEGSALHAESALAAFDVLRTWPMPFRVIGHQRHADPDISCLTAPWLRAEDIVGVTGLPVEHPALAIFYGAPALPGDRMVGAINTLRRYHGLTLHDLRWTADRFPRHPSTRRVRDILCSGAARDLTFSEKEALWRPFANAFGFPAYTMNAPLPGTRRRADVLVHDPPCIIEIDGGLHDITARQDHRRDLEIPRATGLSTLRVDTRDIESAPSATARLLLDGIAALRASRGGR